MDIEGTSGRLASSSASSASPHRRVAAPAHGQDGQSLTDSRSGGLAGWQAAGVILYLLYMCRRKGTGGGLIHPYMHHAYDVYTVFSGCRSRSMPPPPLSAPDSYVVRHGSSSFPRAPDRGRRLGRPARQPGRRAGRKGTVVVLFLISLPPSPSH